ncbi:MAG: AAA family ATPase [Hadesarchaea archaeon]|nr:AAA family ATPase [Hadesarchaea archaeon]
MPQVQTKAVGQAKQLVKSFAELATEGKKTPSVFLWGGPGIGKSSIVEQTVEELGMDPEESFIDQRLQQIDPVDLRGLPFPGDDGRLEFQHPSFLPDDGKGILFLDELNLAPQAVQAAAYELILDRKIGDDYHLPDKWMVVAAGNRSGDKAYVNPMSAPLANRFVHCEVEPRLDDWKNWAFDAGINSEVIGFLNFKSRMLYQFDSERSRYAFPTPRSWEMVSWLMDEGLEDEIASAIGTGAAAEFKSFLDLKDDLPDVEKILEGEIVIPDKPDVLHATISSIVDRVRQDHSKGERLAEYANAIPDNLIEFAVLLMRDAIRAGIPVQNTGEFKKFAQERKNLIIQ